MADEDAEQNSKKKRDRKRKRMSFKDKFDFKQKKKLKKEIKDISLTDLTVENTDEKFINNVNQGRKYTVSIALPGSILENAQSPELRTYLAGQVARALVIFNIDEVIIFNESVKKKESDGLFKGATKASDPNVLFSRILEYLECPQYLRKYFFPLHQDLKYAGLLNPLDCSHHMRAADIVDYREGITLDRPIKNNDGSFVNVGMKKELKIDKRIKPGVRVTVKMDPHNQETVETKKYLSGKVVSPSTPRENDALYWGYSVRVSNTFGAVFNESPYPNGYDLTIGTSDKGEKVDDLTLPYFKHALIVFGGLKGLETSLESDETISTSNIEVLFDHYVNTCPDQGSRTIRTEEAILVTMSALRPKISEVT